MAKNPELEETVVAEMCSYLIENDESFKIFCEESEEMGRVIIKDTGEVKVDLLHKIRIHLARMIGYGYDFTKMADDGKPARETYERAVEVTKKVSGEPAFERFLAEGISGNKFGWYLTRIGL